MNWMHPHAVGATTSGSPMTTAASSEPDCPSSPSAASSARSSGHFDFSTSSRRQSPSTSPLCFGAGGAGTLLWSSSKNRAHASKNTNEDDAAQKASTSTAPKGGEVGKFLRRISRRLLRKARAAAKESPPAMPRRGAAAVDDDAAGERAEAVAGAVEYCKETLRRVAPPQVPSSPSPSLDWWLRDMQEEIIAGAAANHDEGGDDDSEPPPPRPRRDHHRSRVQLPYTHDARESAAAVTESDAAAGELEMRGGFRD